MNLEKQVSTLSELGLPLNEGVTVDDLLLPWSREEYEAAPFDLILFAYGSEIEAEPWGRYFCDRAWNFDAECIEDHGDYAAIVHHFHRIAGRKKRLEEVSDEVDTEANHALLRYRIDGELRDLGPRVDNDWVDPCIARQIMDDMKESGFDFYGKDNGQSTVWFYMTPENATALNNLAGNVFGLAKKPWWKFWQ
jgi:hypothetical protein